VTVIAPEGVEFDIAVYVKGDRGLTGIVRVCGLPVLPELREAIDVQGLMSKLPDGFNWRVMTRAEIAEFKARRGDDD
jgi:hypothetical protein